jgi:hypothetical protein
MTLIEVWERPKDAPAALSGLFEGQEPEARFWAEAYADEIRLRWSRLRVTGEVEFILKPATPTDPRAEPRG